MQLLFTSTQVIFFQNNYTLTKVQFSAALPNSASDTDRGAEWDTEGQVEIIGIHKINHCDGKFLISKKLFRSTSLKYLIVHKSHMVLKFTDSEFLSKVRNV